MTVRRRHCAKQRKLLNKCRTVSRWDGGKWFCSKLPAVGLLDRRATCREGEPPRSPTYLLPSKTAMICAPLGSTMTT